MMAFFRFCFASFRFEAKMMGVLRFRFALFRFEAKMIAIFRFFFVLFSLCSIFVSLQISTFRIDAKEAKKTIFRFRFASFRFEAKMTAHPTSKSRVKEERIHGRNILNASFLKNFPNLKNHF
jgi:hypothetical protein